MHPKYLRRREYLPFRVVSLRGRSHANVLYAELLIELSAPLIPLEYCHSGLLTPNRDFDYDLIAARRKHHSIT